MNQSVKIVFGSRDPHFSAVSMPEEALDKEHIYFVMYDNLGIEMKRIPVGQHCFIMSRDAFNELPIKFAKSVISHGGGVHIFSGKLPLIVKVQYKWMVKWIRNANTLADLGIL